MIQVAAIFIIFAFKPLNLLMNLQLKLLNPLFATTRKEPHCMHFCELIERPL
jgi:hypothetical protein